MSLPEEDRAWLFDRGTWSEVAEDIYSIADKGDNLDLSNAFRKAGYEEKPIIQLGSTENGFSVEVYEISERERRSSTTHALFHQRYDRQQC